MPNVKRLLVLFAASAAAVATPLALEAVPAQASHNQLALFESDGDLQHDPSGTMARLRSLGVGAVRVNVEWSTIAPDATLRTRPNFDAADPNAYPASSWTYLDAVVHAAQANHIVLDFLVTGGAPFWANGSGVPNVGFNRHFAWQPSAREYGDFVHAVGLRYGHSVRYWEIWNEPNFGEDLGPQAVQGSRYSLAPGLYRSLVDAAWRSLNATVSGGKTIVIGQLAARGLGPSRADRSHPEGLPGNFGQTKPLQFIRTLYCVDSRYRFLTRQAASVAGCPTNAAGRRSFRSQHPGLFSAQGFGIHPYPQGLPPTREASRDPDYVAFSEIPKLESTLDRLQKLWGSRKKFAIYNNEYGYVTHPPANDRQFVSPTTGALYINWAEYLSWRNSRIATSMQYLLTDPAIGSGSQFFSGLLFPPAHPGEPGQPKPGYQAYRMPLFLPSSSTRRGRSLEVWGGVRPAHTYGGTQRAQIQWRKGRSGGWRTITNVRLRDSHGYFDVRVKFPGSGYVQVAWQQPGASTLTSRIQAIRIR
jgi:hypothetical protein